MLLLMPLPLPLPVPLPMRLPSPVSWPEYGSVPHSRNHRTYRSVGHGEGLARRRLL